MATLRTEQARFSKKKKQKTHTKQLTVKFLRRPLDVKFQPFPFGRLDRQFPRRLPPNRLNSNSHKGIFSLRFQPNSHSAFSLSLQPFRHTRGRALVSRCVFHLFFRLSENRNGVFLGQIQFDSTFNQPIITSNQFKRLFRMPKCFKTILFVSLDRTRKSGCCSR